MRRYNDLTHRPSTTIAAQMAGNAGPFVFEGPAPCVTTTEVKGTRRPHGNGGHDRASDALWEGTAGTRRRLTVEECATLQGFPDGHPWQGRTKVSRYRQVGNAVPPALAQAVAQVVRDATI